MGRLELPLPELGKGTGGMERMAKEMEDRVKGHVPEELRDSIVVKPFKKGKTTGLAIEYDDRAENFVYIAMEYPRPGRKEESAVPHR